MHYNSEINYAIDYIVSESRHAPIAHDSESINTVAELANLPDTAQLGVEGVKPCPPDVIAVTSLSEYRALYKEVNAKLELGLDAEALERKVMHEEEHAAASRTLGATALRYSLKFATWATPEGLRVCVTPFFCAPGTSYTKLGLASSIAYPNAPSRGDVATLQAMGYENVADVAQRIAAFNQYHPENTLPVPLSCRTQP